MPFFFFFFIKSTILEQYSSTCEECWSCTTLEGRPKQIISLVTYENLYDSCDASERRTSDQEALICSYQEMVPVFYTLNRGLAYAIVP